MEMSLYLMLMLHLTEAAEKYVSFSTVRVGDEATLHCENVIDARNNCDSTVWQFINSRSSTILVQNDKDDEEVATEPDRMNITANCSLVIKKVRAEDFGWYTCRQILSRQQQRADYSVYLSVLDITEQQTNDNVTLICSVWEYKDCRHKVEWLYVGKENITGMKISTGYCSANVTFPTRHLRMSTFYELFMCKMTDGHTKKVQLFTFSPQLSDLAFVTRCIIVSVSLAALLLSVVTINIWTKTKGAP
ncbi:hypothetical protein CHARACLAT_022799 [Characodon lateralis]|uniref:Immunoglobulin domain-containing protein n=1 Tax=Characodon lateralis TaxID=208331 RepID=A0ABU7E332_9TELE|nr:hypothetical protein [Characodon lateralis]